MANRSNTITPVLFPSASYAVGAWYGAGPTRRLPSSTIGDRAPKLNSAWSGVFVVLDVTNVGGAGTVTLKLVGFDNVSAKWFDVPGATTAAIAAVSTITLLVFPGTIESANVRVSHILPPLFDFVATVAGNAVVFSANGWMLGY